eukprot:351992-Chlamydomonas_euryale.AAC.3
MQFEGRALQAWVRACTFERRKTPCHRHDEDVHGCALAGSIASGKASAAGNRKVIEHVLPHIHLLEHVRRCVVAVQQDHHLLPSCHALDLCTRVGQKQRNLPLTCAQRRPACNGNPKTLNPNPAHNGNGGTGGGPVILGRGSACHALHAWRSCCAFHALKSAAELPRALH